YPVIPARRRLSDARDSVRAARVREMVPPAAHLATRPEGPRSSRVRTRYGHREQVDLRTRPGVDRVGLLGDVEPEVAVEQLREDVDRRRELVEEGRPARRVGGAEAAGG